MSSESCQDVVSSNDAEVVASAVYGLVSIGLYIKLIVIIVKNPLFHHPFFYQFIQLSLSNIWLWLAMFVIQRIIPNKAMCEVLFPYFEEPTALLKPLNISYYVPVTIQLLTVMVISLNRMTVILSPISATQFWNQYIRVVLLVILLLSVAYNFYLYDWNGSLQITNGRLGLVFFEGWPRIPLALMAAIMSVTCLVGIIVSAIVSSFFLVRSNVTKIGAAEVNLFWTNVGFSVTTGVLSFYMLMIYFYYYTFYDEEMAGFMISIRGWVFDINCLLPAWLLVFTNGQIRRLLLPTADAKVANVSRIS